MLRFSFPLARIMGVDVRMHFSFLILLAAAVAYGDLGAHNATRGLGLWGALVFAVIVREVARAIAAAYAGLSLRALFLLPVGGIMVLSPQDAGVQGSATPLVLAAPLANFGMGFLLLGLSYATAPSVQLLTQPWISPFHVLRSFVWMQFVLGVVNLLPTAALPSRLTLRGEARTAAATAQTGGPAFSLLTGAAIAMLLGGVVTLNLWFIILGCFALVGSQLQSKTAPSNGAPSTASANPNAESLRVDEVMLTDYALLSSSDTLRGALAQTIHSLQDTFPIVRGNRLVGWVSRQTIAAHLQVEGDSYVQGIMNKSIQAAAPQEQFFTALRRAGGNGRQEFIPVVEDGRMVGLLTSQAWPRAVHQVRQTRPPVEAREPR